MMIPNYLRLPSTKYEDLAACSVDARYAAITNAVETDVDNTQDMDKYSMDALEELVRTVDPDTASSALFGSTNWDEEEAGDGLSVNSPEKVSAIARALGDHSFETPNLNALVEFYRNAADRGDAIAIMFN